jgi:hypothetical protein
MVVLWNFHLPMDDDELRRVRVWRRRSDATKENSDDRRNHQPDPMDAHLPPAMEVAVYATA